MALTAIKKCSFIAVTLTSTATLFGCAHYEVNTGRGNIPGYYIRQEMQQADRAVEAARAAGKDKSCPAEFKAVEEAKDHAYDVFRACHTEEGAALANEATAKANALCPAQAVQPPPPPAAPTDTLTVAPRSVVKGEPAQLSWDSRNADNCEIQPGVGAVPTTGTMSVSAAESTSYTLVCTGPGGTARSAANLTVTEPAPAPAPAPAVPTDRISAAPGSIVKGDTAILSWSSQNASDCEIQPGVGAVPVQGAVTVKPEVNTTYTLICNGAGGTARSETAITVAEPAPVVAPAPVVVPKASAAKLCQPAVINIQFDTNKFDIKPAYHAELQRVADFLMEFPQAKGVIEGHTDSVGDRASNMKLSQHRADSVRKYLVNQLGIAPERLSAKGYGPTRPVADNKTAAGKAQNRRIESNFSCE